MARLLLGVTGSVAAIRTPQILQALQSAGHEVSLIATGSALNFFDPRELNLAQAAGAPGIYTDESEWHPDGYRRGDPVLHIELRRWAELLIIAPLDALTLAKMALGLPDNLLTCLYRAWEPENPILLAPAMNSRMWMHPSTGRHLRQLAEDWRVAVEGDDPEAIIRQVNAACGRLHLLPPVEKELACGDVGMGGMASVEEIAAAAARLLKQPE